MRRYLVSAGTTIITEPLQFPDNAAVIGAGIGRSIIDATAVRGVAIYAPGGQSILDGFTVLGSGLPETVGIQSDNDHRIYNANWGKIAIRNFETGLNLINSGEPSYFNHFDVIRTQACGIGINMDGLGDRLFFSASGIGSHFADNCKVALRINGAERIVINCIQYELCDIGVQAIAGGGLSILGGGIEKIGAIDFDISDDFGSIVYFGTTNAGSILRNVNNGNRATLILPDTDYWLTFTIQGRWFNESVTAA
jgi:hypothetical protein